MSRIATTIGLLLATPPLATGQIPVWNENTGQWEAKFPGDVTSGVVISVNGLTGIVDLSSIYYDKQTIDVKLKNRYTYNQSNAASVWTIDHNLGDYPPVTVVDSAGTVCIGDVQYINQNTIVISFTYAFGGVAYLH